MQAIMDHFADWDRPGPTQDRRLEYVPAVIVQLSGNRDADPEEAATVSNMFAQHVLGVLEAHDGAITLDGKNILTGLRSWQRKLGYVPQPPGTSLYAGGPDNYNQVMEPHRMAQAPPYLQKFVAGPVKLEHNPLSEPMRSFRGSSPPKTFIAQAPSQETDFRHPDAQYERYK